MRFLLVIICLVCQSSAYPNKSALNFQEEAESAYKASQRMHERSPSYFSYNPFRSADQQRAEHEGDISELEHRLHTAFEDEFANEFFDDFLKELMISNIYGDRKMHDFSDYDL